MGQKIYVAALLACVIILNSCTTGTAGEREQRLSESEIGGKEMSQLVNDVNIVSPAKPAPRVRSPASITNSVAWDHTIAWVAA